MRTISLIKYLVAECAEVKDLSPHIPTPTTGWMIQELYVSLACLDAIVLIVLTNEHSNLLTIFWTRLLLRGVESKSMWCVCNLSSDVGTMLRLG